MTGFNHQLGHQQRGGLWSQTGGPFVDAAMGASTALHNSDSNPHDAESLTATAHPSQSIRSNVLMPTNTSLLQLLFPPAAPACRWNLLPHTVTKALCIFWGWGAAGGRLWLGWMWCDGGRFLFQITSHVQMFVTKFPAARIHSDIIISQGCRKLNYKKIVFK